MKTSRTRTAFRLGTSLALATLLISACSSSPAPEESDDGPIVIGHSAGMTGFMSVFDIPVEQGMKMAIDDINAEGGLLGRQLELVTTDNKSETSLIQTSALETIEQDASLLVTSCDYDIGGPAAMTANEENIIAMSCAGGPLYGFDGIGPLAYNLYPGSPTEGAMLAEYAKQLGYQRPYVITDETLEYTQVVGDFFKKRWEDLGGTLAGSASYQNGDDSVAAQVSDIRSTNADVVLAASYPPGGATLLRQLRSAGLTQPIFGAQAFDGTYWLDAVPGLTNFTIPATASLHGDDPNPARNEFFARIVEETGEPAANASYPLAGYSAVQAYARAVERAGTIDTEAVAAELNSFTDEDLLIGPTTFTDTCHIPSGRPMLLIGYTDGKPAVIEERSVESLMGQAPC